MELTELLDETLFEQYLISPSVQSRLEEVRGIMRQSRIKVSTSQTLMRKLVPFMIPAGVKAKVRGDAFNSIVAKELKKSIKRCKVSSTCLRLEEACKHVYEIPDWTLYNRKTNQMLIGYNQIDLWGGGHQINRASKYVLDDCLHRRLQRQGIKIVCVVHAKLPTNTKKDSKMEAICRTGCDKKRIIYREDLYDLVFDFYRK